MKTASLYLIFVCAAALPGAAQERTAVGGPVSGILFDGKTHALRPMIGTPGASYLGEAVLTGVEAASAAPNGTAALAVREGRLYVVQNLTALEPVVLAIEGAPENADLFAWSADGTFAAAYSSSSGEARILRGIGGTPEAGAAMNFSNLPGKVTSLALDGSGEWLIAGSAAENGGGVFAVRAGAEPRLLARALHPAAIAINNHDLYFADRQAQQVWQVSNFDGDAAAMLFAEGLASPVGLQVSADGRRLFVAQAEGRTLDVFDMAARAAAGSVALEFTPNTLYAFGTRSLLVMNGTAGREPLYVLDTSGNDLPGAYFVPAGREQ